MSGILLNLTFVTLMGSVILIIRKIWGEAIHPHVLKCFWILFFLCALYPMSSADPLGKVTMQQVENKKLSEIYSRHFEDSDMKYTGNTDNMDNMDRYRIGRKIKEALPMVWAIGFIAALLYKVVGAAIFYYKSKADCEYTLEPKILEEKGISLFVPVRITKNTGPMVLGTMGLGIRPAIYVPERFLQGDENLFQSIILHEREHIARKHHLLLLLMNLVGSIYWFLPYVERIFFRALREDMEYRCDYELIRKYSVEAKEYARHCIAMAQDKGRLCSELSFGEGRLVRRIQYIQHHRKKTMLSLISGIAAGITVLICVAGATFYYKRDVQGFTRWEVEAAKEALVCYVDASNSGKEDEINAWVAEDSPLWHTIDYLDGGNAIYDISYEPNDWVYYYATRAMTKRGLDINNSIYLKTKYVLHGRLYREWFFLLVREDKNSSWKIYDNGS